MIYLFNDKMYEGVASLPLLEIRFRTLSLDLASFDAIIFTSQNSVKALIQSTSLWQDKACYAIGEATAQALKEAGAGVVFTCKESYGDVFAHQIAPLLLNQKVFFPRAKEMVSPVGAILKEAGVDVEECIVYESVCKTYDACKAPPKDAILIFTSPSIVACFHSNFPWDTSYKAIAIGHKTAAAFPLHVKVLLAKKQTLASCIELAKQIRS